MATRRDFLKGTAAAAAGAVVAGCSGGGGGGVETPAQTAAGRPPNILLVLTDQMRLPPVGYAPGEGEADGVKEILGFADQLSPGNPFLPYFEGILRLRKNAIVCRRHYIASAACAPSRTTFLTGQYPSLHGVTQVDGLFKSADEIQFLDPAGVPTLGDWFRAAGFDTYYFGKWHVSEVEPPYSLEPWGFCCYETSGPEPHGSNPDNFGVYRDPGFADIVRDFLNGDAQTSQKPWFAVASLVNPHDIAAFPAPFFMPAQAGVTAPTGLLTQPQPIPPQGRISDPSDSGVTVPLNPNGFPQASFTTPMTASEDMSGKPECHLDSAWKVQLGLRSLFPQFFALTQPYPTQAPSPQAAEWVEKYGQFYVYLQHLMDLELRRIFEAFDASGLADNTIVVFTSDHGEHGMAHGQMVQKWHTAYEETVRVPFVVSSPLVNADPDVLREFEAPTSHIDLAPTLLGLAGISGAQLQNVQNAITGHQPRTLPGTDLTPFLVGASSGAPARPGVLYTTDDLITELPEGVANPVKQPQWDQFIQSVDNSIQLGAPLAPGVVRQPNHVRMLCTGDWKLVRYLDPSGVEADQWEMYHLAVDGREVVNLVDFRTGELRPQVATPELQAKLVELRAALAEQEATMLLTPA